MFDEIGAKKEKENFEPFSAWCPLKDLIYLNKPNLQVCFRMCHFLVDNRH